MAKLDGVPVQQMITMGAEGDGMQGANGGQQQQQQPQAERPSLGSALGGRLGGLGGLGRKKKEDKPADQPAAAAPANSGNPGSLLEMTTEMTNFSSNAADPSLFAVPAGFTKVDSDLKKMK